MGHGAEVGKKAKGVKSENIEGRRGDEGSLEVFWRRTAGGDDAFYVNFVSSLLELSGSTKGLTLKSNVEL